MSSTSLFQLLSLFFSQSRTLLGRRSYYVGWVILGRGSKKQYVGTTSENAGGIAARWSCGRTRSEQEVDDAESGRCGEQWTGRTGEILPVQTQGNTAFISIIFGENTWPPGLIKIVGLQQQAARRTQP
ncbi:hypothetical protein B0H13DRAFT_1907558 [Mycena leptocephala]|nr:hypothetical protein B0H13DRAFT_1907558 [Mycena leptocephala]